MLIVLSGFALPALIRYLLKKPMDKWPAIGVCIFLWPFNIVLFYALDGNWRAALPVAFASYWMIRKAQTAKEKAQYRVEINDGSGDGSTPLMEAAMLGKLKRIRDLIAAGANIDSADERGWTALMYAARANEAEAVELLLENRANPDLRNSENQTAFEIAQAKENFEVVTALQKWQEDAETPNLKTQEDVLRAGKGSR